VLTELLGRGSPALKTDYTRSGTRTMFGAAKDLRSSLTRWYVNNFVDGVRQVCCCTHWRPAAASQTHSQLDLLYIFIYSCGCGIYMCAAELMRAAVQDASDFFLGQHHLELSPAYSSAYGSVDEGNAAAVAMIDEDYGAPWQLQGMAGMLFFGVLVGWAAGWL
jgi:hypothetical protein